MKPVLDDVFFGKKVQMLYLLPPLIVLLYAIKGVMSYTHNYQMSYIGNATVTTLRDQLFASLQRQPLSFFDGEATGTLMSRLTYDVNLLQNAVTRVITSFFKDSFTVLGLSAVIFYREWRLALLAMAVFPVAVFLILWLGKRTRRGSHQTQVSNAHLYTVLQESLIGQRIVKAFAREDYEEQRFFKANWDYFRTRMRLNAIRELSPPSMEFLGSLGMGGIIFYGGYAVINGTSTPGTFFSFLAALLMLETQVSNAHLFSVLQESLIGQRIVKAFAREDYEEQRFFKANWDYFRTRMRLNVIRELSPPSMEFLGSLGMGGIIFYGGYAVIQGTSTPGTFFSFLAALLMLYQPIKSLSVVQNILQEGLAAAVRVFGLMDRDPEIKDRLGATALPPLQKEIAYRGVAFAYDNGHERLAGHQPHGGPGRDRRPGGTLRGRQIHPAEPPAPLL